jgi:thiamine kinase-like enzyme
VSQDIQPNNLIYLGNEFKAVDYESAAQSDPYFDVATVAIYYCFNPKFEHVLFTTYLERQPSEQETAKLYLMKLVAEIHYGLIFLKLGIQYIDQYAILSVPSYWEFLSTLGKEKVDLDEPKYKMSMAKILINDVVANFESQEFRDAIRVLSK